MSHLRPLSMIGGIICIDFADQLLSETAVHGLSTGPWFFGSCSKPFSSLNLYPCCLRNDRKRVKWCLGGYILLSTTKGKIERRLREGQKKKESVVLVNTHSCPHPLVYSWWANGFQHFEREEKKVQKKKKKKNPSLCLLLLFPYLFHVQNWLFHKCGGNGTNSRCNLNEKYGSSLLVNGVVKFLY